MKRWVGGAGAVLLVAGALLARVTESGVAISRVALPTGPALRVAPIASAVHPKALLGHGVSASKETLIRLAEALAASGFECLIVDFPGHGESRAAFGWTDATSVFVEGAHALAGGHRVDVVAGHSMGAYVAAHALEKGAVEAKLLLAFGAIPHASTETLLLEGAWDELLTPPAGAVVSSWSDHCLEPWDPVLVDAAVRAACAKTGLQPAPVGAWKLRVLGGLLTLAGVLGVLAGLIPPRGGPAVGLAAGAVALLWPILGLPLWFAGAPTLRHLPLQVLLAVGAGLSSLTIERIVKRPAWATQAIFPAVALLLALSQVFAGNHFPALAGGILTAVVASAWALGAFAEVRTKSADAGHAAFGLWLGYLLGQWCPLPW